MKQKLYRSITFWAGILVMGFICWAWWDSMHAGLYVTNGRGFAASSSGGLCFHRFPIGRSEPYHWQRKSPFLAIAEIEALPAPFWIRGAGTAQVPVIVIRNQEGQQAPRRPTVQGFLTEGAKYAAPAYVACFIPYWLLLLAVVLPWCALLLWRTRRRKRAALTAE